MADAVAGRAARVVDRGRKGHPGGGGDRHVSLRDLLARTWFLRLVCYGGLVIVWQVVALVMGPFYLPTVPQLLGGIVKIFTEGYYLTLLSTLEQLVIGFGIACAVAIPIGALMGRSRIFDDLLSPYVNTIFVTSRESLLPLIIIAFGVGLQYRVAVVILFSIFFPIMNTAAGVRYVDKNLIETARAFCTGPRRTLIQVYLPAAAPFVLAGIRLGLGMALKGMIIAELWITVGTGRLLKTTGSQRKLDLFFGLAILIIMIAVAASQGLKALERRMDPGTRAREAMRAA
ncbi:MAG TPA: ABC transporter permease subunit [Actinomycetota bacterium]|nr:ABC transporter permease subunit [Actinomycetota bacterium]